jgi:putative transposase
MDKQTTNDRDGSMTTWDNLDEYVRLNVQTFIQSVLEEEVTEFLGRAKSARRPLVDGGAGYRNGHGKPRKLTLPCGTIEVRRPRVRDVEEEFESRVMPLFVRRTKRLDGLLPELYLHGLALGDFELAMKGVLGSDAPVSESVISRLREKWQIEYSTWKVRDLKDLEPVYMWIDGVYVKAGFEKEKAALLVVLVGLADGRKVFVAIEPGHRESTEGWSSVFRDLRDRGLRCPKLIAGDGNLGAWAAIRSVFPEAAEQRCWNHRTVNILDRIKKDAQATAKHLITKIAYADDKKTATKAKETFDAWCTKTDHEAAAQLLEKDWDRMLTFMDFPKEHWIHLRTTNPIESPFGALRLRTDAARRFKKVRNATAMIWKLLALAEKKFRKLNEPDLLKAVFDGAKFENGKRVKESKTTKGQAAA